MSDETIIELARLLAEATRARRLAEVAAMAPTLRAEAEQRGDALEAAQAQIVELRAKLADTEARLADTAASLTLQRERADHATAEMDRMQRTRSQMLVGRASDASRLEQELRVLRDEVAAQNVNVAREREVYQTKIDRIMRVFAGLVDTANDHVDLATIRASFNTARDIARGES